MCLQADRSLRDKRYSAWIAEPGELHLAARGKGSESYEMAFWVRLISMRCTSRCSLSQSYASVSEPRIKKGCFCAVACADLQRRCPGRRKYVSKTRPPNLLQKGTTRRDRRARDCEPKPMFARNCTPKLRQGCRGSRGFFRHWKLEKAFEFHASDCG